MKPFFRLLLSTTLLLFTSTGWLSAQVNLQNNGILYVGTATDTVYVNGAFGNASGAALTNNGMLQVVGDVGNDQAAMTAGTGTLYLTGNSLQTLGGTQTFKTFNLVTNNVAGILLTVNLSVAGLHTFTKGLITTSATPNYLAYESGSSYTGDGDNAHVYGWVKKTGSTNFIFPVGNAAYERTIALTNLTATSEFNVKHNGSPTPNRMQLHDPLVYVDTSEYWTINKVSGSAAKVAMNWDHSKVRFPLLMLSDIRAVYFDGTFWTNIGGSATGDPRTTGSLTSNSVSAFNANFTFGSISVVLPLQILNFDAGPANGYTKLYWRIANELGVSHYNLQRSEDGISFRSISLQDPNSSSNGQYVYNDNLPIQGIAYYRLCCVQKDGSLKYSAVVTVSQTAARDKELYVINDLFTGSINIHAGNSCIGVYHYIIVNMAGQVLQSGQLDIKNAGLQTIALRVNLTAGMYVLSLSNATHRLQQNIVKE